VLFVAGLGLASGAAADSHSMVLAAAMGLAAGVVLGLLTYFGLSRVKPQHLFGVTGAMLFLAGISYALYVIHPILSESWLGSGDVVEKYAKRPLLFAVLFALAYVSTYCYERPLIELGKKWFSPFQAPWRP
jgi:peptidoglycan/LPS O-acetylase OafA/YrhL